MTLPALSSAIRVQFNSTKIDASWTIPRKFRAVAVGKVKESEAKDTAARVDYVLMRIRQRLLEVPTGMNIVMFIEHDGRPPPAAVIASQTTILKSAAGGGPNFAPVQYLICYSV